MKHIVLPVEPEPVVAEARRALGMETPHTECFACKRADVADGDEGCTATTTLVLAEPSFQAALALVKGYELKWVDSKPHVGGEP